VVIALRNQILKVVLENYLQKNFKIECRIKKANLDLNNISFEKIKISHQEISLDIQKLDILFSLRKVFQPALTNIQLSGVSLTVQKIAQLKDLGLAMPRPKTKQATPFSLNLRLQDASVNLKNVDLETKFSVVADLETSAVTIKDIKISNLDIHSTDLDISGLGLEKIKPNIYALRISLLKIKQKEFKNFFIPIKFFKNKIVFLKSKNQLFAESGTVNAVLDLKPYDSFCFVCSLNGTSLDKIVSIFAGEENVSVKGEFDGNIHVCMQGETLVIVEGQLRNRGNGFINIKKEDSLAFFKPYLDHPSYIALIDNFKNYEYNIGKITAKKAGSVLSLEMNFDSKVMGERNITINLHDILNNDK
jgi:hypothetical protein